VAVSVLLVVDVDYFPASCHHAESSAVNDEYHRAQETNEKSVAMHAFCDSAVMPVHAANDPNVVAELCLDVRRQ
jgi:hypothetical protein